MSNGENAAEIHLAFIGLERALLRKTVSDEGINHTLIEAIIN